MNPYAEAIQQGAGSQVGLRSVELDAWQRAQVEGGTWKSARNANGKWEATYEPFGSVRQLWLRDPHVAWDPPHQHVLRRKQRGQDLEGGHLGAHLCVLGHSEPMKTDWTAKRDWDRGALTGIVSRWRHFPGGFDTGRRGDSAGHWDRCELLWEGRAEASKGGRGYLCWATCEPLREGHTEASKGGSGYLLGGLVGDAWLWDLDFDLESPMGGSMEFEPSRIHERRMAEWADKRTTTRHELRWGLCEHEKNFRWGGGG